MSLINPVEVVINWFLANAASFGVGTRVAGQHRFGTENAWTPGQRCITARMDDAELSNYVPLHAVRLEVRFYGASQADAAAMWMAMLPLARAVRRNAISTDLGNALLHSLVQSSGPSMLYDPEINVDYVLMFWTGIIGENSI
jgi:hypothetical protein